MIHFVCREEKSWGC